jgi:hypothetical protein
MGSLQIEGASEILELKVLGDWAFIRNRIEITATALGGNPYQPLPRKSRPANEIS